MSSLKILLNLCFISSSFLKEKKCQCQYKCIRNGSTPLIHGPIDFYVKSSISSRHTSFVLSSNKVAIIACQSNTLWCLVLKIIILLMAYKTELVPGNSDAPYRYFRSDEQTKCTLFINLVQFF